MNQHGDFGNLSSTTDPNGNVTSFVWDSATYANITQVTVNPLNGTGTQTVTRTYDYATGSLLSETDANGKTTDTSYTNILLNAPDPFLRPGLVTAPAVTSVVNGVTYANQRRRVKTTYSDATRQVLSESDLNQEDDKKLKSRVTFDQLGRAALTEKNEDGTASYTISSQNVYITPGLVILTANPKRDGATSTDGWTRSTLDTLGRVIEVATFSGAAQPPSSGTNSNWTGKVMTTYYAHQTTVTDQTGKSRKSETDALGRLIKVWEDPAGANYETSYEYDVLDSLKKVTQGIAPNQQTRTFVYDSLKRVTSATNPESGTTTYTYDPNGNLLTKTDARTTRTAFAYDGLNRVTQKTYPIYAGISTEGTNAANATPGVYYKYDAPVSGMGEPSGFNFGVTKGRLVAVRYGSSSDSKGSYFGYDEFGRVVRKTQQINGNNYPVVATFNLVSAMTSEAYPSGRAVTYTYDAAGRPASFSGTLGTGGAPTTYSNATQYSAAGQVERENYGMTTPLYLKRVYNNRLQPVDLRLGTVNDATNWNRGRMSWIYGTATLNTANTRDTTGAEVTTADLLGNASDNNGNVRRMYHAVPTGVDGNQQVNAYVIPQRHTYQYDQLNRINEVVETQRQTSGSGTMVQTASQNYSYDPFGNRQITGVTGGVNGVSLSYDAKNRITTSNFVYDNGVANSVGNLTSEPNGVSRTYDAENRIVSATGPGSGSYVYDGEGQRVKRTSNGTERWHIYGIGGELLAEYLASAPSPSAVKKEYGYRNGKLLIVADNETSGGGGGQQTTNLALNKTATQSSTAWSGVPSRAVDGNTNGNYNATPPSVTHTGLDAQAWWHVDLGSVGTINTINVWNRTDCCANRLTNFYVFVSDVPFTSTNLNSTLSQSGVGSYLTSGQAGLPTTLTINRTGRYVRVQLVGTNELSLAEVEVMGTTSSSTSNLALNKTATQSSTAWSGVPSRAVDGNTNGNYNATPPSVTHTGLDAQAWWHVDLGSVGTINTINVWNRTDCCANRLTNFYVFVSDVPFTSTNLNSTLSQSGVGSYLTSGQAGLPTTLTINRTGRYVRVQLVGTNELSLAEVEVMGTTSSSPSNLALNKTATQSSTTWDGVPTRAVDGNTNGNYNATPPSVTHTAVEAQAWWHVDLGSVGTINTINVWNRTDCCADRLTNFYVFVSDVPFASTNLSATLSQSGVSNYLTSGQAGSPTTLTINRTGRYVRVQLVGTNALSLAEVEIIGTTGSSGGGGGNILTWLVQDHLGSTRMEANAAGSITARHDYLPFGEELNTGIRANNAHGYVASNTRQRFTGYERDNESELDFAQARYYASKHGRFTSVDPLQGSGRAWNPQSWNRYSYVLNRPLSLIDPTGLEGEDLDEQNGDTDDLQSGRKKEEQESINVTSKVNLPKITSAKSSGSLSRELPVGGSFTVEYRYEINNPAGQDGVDQNPANYGSVQPIKDGGTLSSQASPIELTNSTSETRARGDVIEVAKKDTFKVTDAAHSVINYQIVVKDPLTTATDTLSSRSSATSTREIITYKDDKGYPKQKEGRERPLSIFVDSKSKSRR
ncbi:MAG: hypothetical protein HOP19_11245 [Acidobacteria bacterium]|nr:hypothetical protein [Acidobacteriota bacterium]